MKTKKQITYLQYSVIQNLHHHYKREGWKNNEEILAQSKTENPQGKLQFFISLSDTKAVFRIETPSRIYDCNIPFFLGPSSHSSSSSPLKLYHDSGISNVLRGSNKIQPLPSHIHSISSLVLNARDSMTLKCLTVAVEGDPITPFFCH